MPLGPPERPGRGMPNSYAAYGHTALSVATDGIVVRHGFIQGHSDRPASAPHNLGKWEPDGHGELLVQLSGVYSVLNSGSTWERKPSSH